MKGVRPVNDGGHKEARSNAVRLQLYDPRLGDASLKLGRLKSGEQFTKPQRFNYFTVLWIETGKGCVEANITPYKFAAPALLFFTPYQTFFVRPEQFFAGVSLQFHANFFCIETHHAAVGCNGVLFNDIYGSPVVRLKGTENEDVGALLLKMEREIEDAGLAHSEVLVSYLKVFLIKATRVKLEQQKWDPGSRSLKPEILERLVEFVEINYREKHSPSDYAKLLGISEKALNKLVKGHFGKTLTQLIRERILKYAKWHLLHTRKPVKEVAGEVGFADEFYFSRLFKRATGFAPTAFREFETAIRSGRNLTS